MNYTLDDIQDFRTVKELYIDIYDKHIDELNNLISLRPNNLESYKEHCSELILLITSDVRHIYELHREQDKKLGLINSYLDKGEEQVETPEERKYYEECCNNLGADDYACCDTYKQCTCSSNSRCQC